MFFLEKAFRDLGVEPVSRVVVWGRAADPFVIRDLSDELRDVFPEAELLPADAAEPLPACDVLVVPLTDRCELPLDDVIYRHLDDVEFLLRLRDRVRFFLFYQTDWRRVSLVDSPSLERRLRRWTLERAAIRWWPRIPLLRSLLEPRF